MPKRTATAAQQPDPPAPLTEAEKERMDALRGKLWLVSDPLTGAETAEFESLDERYISSGQCARNFLETHKKVEADHKALIMDTKKWIPPDIWREFHQTKLIVMPGGKRRGKTSNGTPKLLSPTGRTQ